MRQISWFIFLRHTNLSGMTSRNTSPCWSITSSVVITPALMFSLVGVLLTLIQNLGRSMANQRHSIIAPCCFRNGISITVSYFARFPTSILFPFICGLPTAMLMVHFPCFSDHDLFKAMSILVGSFIAAHGIPWVVTMTALKRLPPVIPVSNRTLHQGNVGAWSKVVLNAPGPPRGVVVPVVHLVHSDPL